MGRLFLFLLIILLVSTSSCSDKYLALRSRYTFKSSNGKPDYTNLDYWAAHPRKWDPSDSIPAPLKQEPKDSAADVFFIHPTTYTRHISSSNAAIDDDYLAAKSDFSSILYQASVFNQRARIFAPRYRQSSIKVFFTTDTALQQASFDTAYSDVAAAFQYYLLHWNQGRPFIIAGHSQGSLIAERLLKEFVEDKPLQRQLVVAYVPGWPVPKNYFRSLKMCADSTETGCICSWRTLRRNYLPDYLKNENGNSFATNPLTWTTDGRHAPRSKNLGSVLFKFNRIFKSTTDARVENGLLFVHKPRFPWSFLLWRRNYHVGDINLYYMNLRHNAGQRIAAFLR